MRGMAYADDVAILHQTRQLLALGTTSPEFAGSLVCRDINGAEGQLVGLQNGLYTGGGGDNMGGARGERGVEVKCWVGHDEEVRGGERIEDSGGQKRVQFMKPKKVRQKPSSDAP